MTRASRPTAASCSSRTRTAPAGTAPEIGEGLALVEAGFRGSGRRRSPGPYLLQAAIAARPCPQRATRRATDWREIAPLYGVLATVAPSPVVELNRAVAVAMADGPGPGSSWSTRWRTARLPTTTSPCRAGGPAPTARAAPGGGRGVRAGARPRHERRRARLPRPAPGRGASRRLRGVAKAACHRDGGATGAIRTDDAGRTAIRARRPANTLRTARESREPRGRRPEVRARSASPRVDFVLRNTRLRPVPGSEELRLHLADEVLPLWQAVRWRPAILTRRSRTGRSPGSGGLAIGRYLGDHPER